MLQQQKMKDDLKTHSLKQVIIFQEKINQSFVMKAQENIFKSIDDEIEKLIEQKRSTHDADQKADKDLLDKTLRQIVFSQTISEKTFDKKGLITGGYTMHSLEQTQLHTNTKNAST